MRLADKLLPLTVVLAATLITADANAGLVTSMVGSYSGPAAIAVTGVNSGIIAAPTSVAEDAPGFTSPFMVGFNERQAAALTSTITFSASNGRRYNGTVNGVGSGSLASGMLVDSHMILLNTPTAATTTMVVTWTFDSDILGVIFDRNGALHDATDYLGAPGTFYPNGFTSRGFESSSTDYVRFLDARTLLVSSRVSEPGDWIRVLTDGSGPSGTADPIPVPGTALLFASGMAVLGWSRRSA